ncbi:MAG: ABC transporter ATP-binding protein [Chloroflexota bacterium]
MQLQRALRLVWQTARYWTLVNTLLVVIQGTLPLAALYLMKRLLDAVSASLSGPKTALNFQPVLFWIIMAAAVAVLTAVIRSISEYAAEAQSEQVTDEVADILHAQSIAVDLDYYEESSFYDTLHRAQKEAPYRPTRIVNGLIQIAQNSISLLGILGLLFTFNGLLAVVLLLAAMPSVFVRLRFSKRMFGFQQRQTESERRAWYYHTILTDVPYAKEIRLYNLGDMFKLRYRDLRDEIRTGKLMISGQRVRADLSAQLLSTFALFGSLVWIAWQTFQGSVSLGDLLIYYLGFQNGLNYFQAVLRSLAGLYEDNLFLTSFYQFLDLTPGIVSPVSPRVVPQPMQKGITFSNVSFTYPSRQVEALNGINLSLAPGEVIALVGENGSGKTTLIKLLCRLYDPSAGNIQVDGIDLCEMDPIQWRKELGVTFQDYAHYALTAQENIWLGDNTTPPELDGIAAAGKRSGAHQFIQRLPQQYDTQLGQWFKQGQELSGGEWQKIALARSFWRDARILILDEPTSALDPLAEEALFREFRAMLEGEARSAILISHRFSTVQMADKIYVMEQGQIVENGTHADLIALNGRYAHLYNAQAQYYVEK